MNDIPMPRRLPVIGHLHQIPRGKFMQHLIAVARAQEEGIVSLDFGGRIGIIVSSAELARELCDETRFRKVLGAGLNKVRDFAGDGLFTAHGTEANWAKAHRILMPAFSARAMRGYFPVMLDVAEQLVAKWAHRQNQDLLVADDMTRLTLDTISLAGFGYRFNSFASEALHPFLASMTRGLEEAMAGLTRLPFTKLFPQKERQRRYEADIAAMFKLVDDVIAERKRHPTDGNDLLNLMLTAVDPETKTTLEDINIRYQVITFLIAGHETTSGLLTFALYLLLRHPAILAQAYAEVDAVLPGGKTPEYSDISKLTVIERVLKETQRLWPTAPAVTLGAFKDEVIGGRYHIPKNYPVVLLIAALHRDARAWPNPDSFDIDRFLPEREAMIDPYAYRPFGTGVRACIGRQFALVEAKLALAMILQNFALHDAHDYKLSIKESLTIKPDNFFMRVRARRPHERIRPPALPAGNLAAAAVAPAAATASGAGLAGAGRQLAVFWGTSLGTCRDIAEQIADRAEAAGFDVQRGPLDDCADGLPETGIMIAVCATYNGRAADSAQRLEAAVLAQKFAGQQRPALQFATLGCGNTQWRDTYQAFPKMVDGMLSATGATAILPRGEADADGDFDGAVEGWTARLFALLGDTATAAAPALRANFIDAELTRSETLPEHALALRVLENRELTRDATGLWDFAQEAPRPPARHIELALPEGVTYETGDHIAVYARNRAELVDAAITRLGLRGDQLVILAGSGGRMRHLPIGKPVSVRQLLSDFVELQEPASRNDLRALREAVRCPNTIAALERLLGDDDAARAAFAAEIADKRVSVLELLLQYPAIELELEHFVALCSAIRPRFYSISSTPLEDAGRASLTVGTVAAPAWSGVGQYRGFASTYLMGLQPGDTLLGYVRRPSPLFAPPDDPRQRMILVGPGTGIAPLRGFLAERLAQKRAGQTVGQSLLFYGCRHPDHDWFYREEMQSWEAVGIVRVITAFSALAGHPHRFVQDAMAAQADAIWEALEDNAAIFVCGDGRFMAPAVRAALIAIYQARMHVTHEAASAWLEGLIGAEIYRQDVFGS